MSPRGPSSLAAAAVLAVLIALAYGGSIGNEFVFDDAIFMERDERVQSFGDARRLLTEPLWGFQDAHGRGGIHQYYRPLQLLPLVIANEWFAGAAWPCHAINLAMHFGVSLLVFALLAGVTTERSLSLWLAAVFAVHPAGSEAVLWVSDFAGLGVAFATLSVLLVHARARSAPIAFFSVAALSLFGMFCKESGTLIIVTMILFDLFVGRLWRGRENALNGHPGIAPQVGAYLGVIVATVIYLQLRNTALGGMLPGVAQLELTPAALAINAVALLPSYVATYFWPVDLNMYHDFDAVASVREPAFVAGVGISLLWLGLTLACSRRHRGAAFGLAFAAIAVAPYLLARWPQLNVYAERYTYLPSVGLLLATADVVAPRFSGSRASAAVVVALLICFVVLDRQRTAEWHDEVSIYEKTLTQSPRAELIRNNLALRYLSLGTPERGIPLQQRLLEIDPDFRSGWHNLGLLYLADDQPKRALEAFTKAVYYEPRNAASWLNLGYVRDASGQRVAAIDAYFRATIFDPLETKALYNLAVIALEMGQPANAALALRQLQALDANDEASAQLLATAESTATHQPTDAMVRALGRQLEVGRQAVESRRWIQAEAALRTATWLDASAHLPHHYLANVYYLRGRTADALESETAALERAPRNSLYKKNAASLKASLRGDSGAQPGFAPR